MYSFIVLGIIPGTTIQITFQTWLFTAQLLALLISLSLLISRVWRKSTSSPLPINPDFRQSLLEYLNRLGRKHASGDPIA